ncbi:MAG TPA: trigger factor [Ktedonobacteraceae bacterium]|nr:trigger factor [Ktedonobacteraceae bacterium]
MKVSVEKLPSSEAVLNVDLTWEDLEKASDKAYRKLVKQFDVPGFRRGKAPRSLLERKLGKESIYQEGLDELINETYRNAIKEHELSPIKPPELDAPILEIGQPYHFSLKVPILSPVVLGDYHALHIDREEVEVTSEEVESEIESLRNRQATWQTVERPADYGDRVTVDLKLTVEEQGISDLKDNPFELTQERHGLFVGMDEQIVGMQVGDSKEFTTTIPADYTNEKLAGKEANYHVNLYKVEVKEVPELDDAFATQASDGKAGTMEDLRKVISDEILENKQRRVRDELREKVISAVVEQAQVTLHPVLIDEEAEEMLHQLSHMLEQQRMSLDQYLMLVKKTREEYLQDVRPDAENRVKRQLVLDEVARAEEISVAPEELESLYRAYAQVGQQLGRSEEQIRSVFVAYRREKTITQLVEVIVGPEDDESNLTEQSIENAEAAALAGESDVEAVIEAAIEAGQETTLAAEYAAEVPAATDAGDTIAVAASEETSNVETGAQ